MKKLLFIPLVLSLVSCSVAPTDLPVVQNFQLNKYLGTWYEIARLPNRFEKDLHKVTANYSLKSDGGVKVLNKGFNISSKEWEEAEGKAYFTSNENVAALKVSFFGPFYGGYNVIELDADNYQYALVAGPKREYLWILARDPNIDKSIVNDLVSKAQSKGFPTNKLEFINHN
ncbi:lipocalin family protein [Kangiella sp. HZ709]|uniref:lipocalin family protein n=1 Tax=Kangiella sp. HZ709 TaxID=2666328 RepID=UPI0012B1487F|nr:lipocalin family protein [Kangiella sp. HZ709]MRX26632.1 lipocalin [Kangiella sp. HZ709]